MNKTIKVIALFLTVIGIAGALSYLIWKAPLSLYIGWGAMVLAVAVIINILPGPISKIEVTLMSSSMLAAGAFVAYVGFHDPPAAWFFLIAAVLSLPIMLFASRYLRSTSLEGQEISGPQASEPQQGLWPRLGRLFIEGLSLGLTAAFLVITGYLGWRTWPKVSRNVLILATLLLIFLTILSMVIKQADKKPERWLSIEGLFALANLLYKLLLPVMFVLLLLNFAIK